MTYTNPTCLLVVLCLDWSTYLVKDSACNSKQIDNGWRGPRSYDFKSFKVSVWLFAFKPDLTRLSFVLGLVIYELLKFELHSYLKEKQNKILEFHWSSSRYLLAITWLYLFLSNSFENDRSHGVDKIYFICRRPKINLRFSLKHYFYAIWWWWCRFLYPCFFSMIIIFQFTFGY